MKYAPLPKITADDAENEPVDQQLFAPRITITATVAYRGRQLVVTAEDLSADKFCDLLDKRFGPPASAAHAPASPANAGNGYKFPTDFSADGTPLCDNRNCSHFGQPMGPSKFGGWHCQGKDSKTGNAKGYCKEIA